MCDQLLDYDILQMDETVVQVLKEAGRPAQTKSTLWVQRGGPPDACVILYDDIASLGGEVAERLLADHAGYLQNNGYGRYNAVVAANAIVALGCMGACPSSLRRSG